MDFIFFISLVVILPLKVFSAGNYTELSKITYDTTEHSDLELLVTNILYDRIKHIKCFIIMCDNYYSDVFTKRMFKRLRVHTTYFVIHVDESEDLLSPYNSTQDTLNQARVASCTFYVILLANPIQVSRLLRFGDKYRVLNTRSNFILPYDIRLFHKSLHYLWKRIVNVIFIREYGNTYRSKQAAVPWFEISTVPFPTPIQGVFIPRRLDTWKKGRFILGTNLFRDKTIDLLHQALRVVTFQHIPATVKTENYTNNNIYSLLKYGAVAFTGLEIEILQTLAYKMNFLPKIYEPPNADTEKWGRKQGGKFSGLIGEMVNFQAEIALGDLYYNPYHLELMDLTIPYNTECLTFLTPESSRDNSWMTLILPFQLYMWITVLLALIISVFIFFALARYHRYLYENFQKKSFITQNIITNSFSVSEKVYFYTKITEAVPDEAIEDEDKPSGLYIFDEMFNSFLYTYSMVLLVSLPKLPTGWSLRMFTGWYWIYCTLLVVSYKASMTAILANPAPRITIDTLEELDASELECGGWSENIKEFFLTSLDVAGQHIGAKYTHINSSAAAVERVAKSQFAYYENIYYLKAASVQYQLRIRERNNKGTTANDNGNRKLHIMSNCVINMPISLGLQKNSPIKPRVDKFIRRVIEGGFIKKWLNDAMQATFTSEIHTASDKEVKALMNLKKFYGGFVALFIGYFIGVTALSVEILYWKLKITKNPYFDKYTRRIYTPRKVKNCI